MKSLVPNFLLTACFGLGLSAAVFIAESADAQVGDRRNGVVTQLPRVDVENLRAWLRDRSAEVPGIEFKVPAEILTDILCTFRPAGITCYEYVITRQCPSDVVVQTPDGGTMSVPVECTGPGSDGNCDCDFVGG